MDNMQIYNAGRTVPPEAQRRIEAGRLKGMTDINPVWRIAKLTELFGPCGIGWKYEITRRELVAGANGETACFVDINLYYRHEGAWSEAVPGTGGSSFVAKERNGMYTSDECYKMALTDAISVAGQALGVGADVYWAAGRSKYTGNPEPERAPAEKAGPAPMFVCEECGAQLSTYKDANGREIGIRRHAEGSKAKFGKILCLDCIARHRAAQQ